MSVQVNGAPVPGFQAYSLQSAFDPPRTAILIWGDSGTGKTRLAHEFARLADTKYDNIRVARSHPMLPLFIDDDPFSYPAVNPSWSEAILTKLKTELGPESHPGLYLHLLESKRVLVLIDGLSEMSGKTQELLERDLPTLPARALILTSRRHERLRGVALTEIETGAIQSDRLAASIDECLRARNQRGLFPDDEYLESVPRLAKLASPSPVTMGLLTIYCDVLIAFKRSSPPSSPNLKDVVELMESYRDSQVLSENATKANELAWRCVSETLRPIAVTGEVENELAPLVWPVAPGRVHFRIPLLAEYLAAIHIAEVNGSSEESWRTFLASTQKVDGAPTSIRSFLNALRDVVAAKAEALRIPDAMLGEMIPVLGEPLPRVRGEIRTRRVGVLVSNLSEGRGSSAEIIRELGDYGPDALSAVPVLRNLVKQGRAPIASVSVTYTPAPVLMEALGRIDPSSLPQLNEEQSRAAEISRWRERIRGFLPKDNPSIFNGISIAHRYAPAEELSGDFYQFIPRPDDTVGIYLVDVEGHGPRAAKDAEAIYLALSRPSDANPWGRGDPRQEIERADRLLAEQDLFASMSFADINRAAKRIRFANAGMRPAMLFRTGESIPEMLLASGVYAGKGYGQFPSRRPEAEVPLADGDLLVLFSDGIVEARDARGRKFGYEGVTAAVATARWSAPLDIADAIVSAASTHAGHGTPEDDQALIIVQIGEVTREGFAPSTLESVSAEDSLEFGLRNAGDSGAAIFLKLRRRLLEWVNARLSNTDRARQVWGATWEAIQNAFKYGSGRGDVIRIRLHATADVVSVELRQPRYWPRWQNEFGLSRRAEVLSGKRLGIEIGGGTVIMIRLADEIEIGTNALRLTMLFRRAEGPKQPPAAPVQV